jgi:hypothetical protein
MKSLPFVSSSFSPHINYFTKMPMAYCINANDSLPCAFGDIKSSVQGKHAYEQYTTYPTSFSSSFLDKDKQIHKLSLINTT